MPSRLASACFVAVSVVVAAGASAQERIAMLTGVQGTVLVSKGDGMSAAVNGQALPAGTRVVATNRSGAVIAYDNGCTVPVGENARTVVRHDASCARLKTDVIVLAQAPGALGGGRFGTGAGGMNLGVNLFLVGVGASTTYEAVNNARRNTTASPN